MNTPLTDLISLSNKTALVTGAGMGIGNAIATRLHEAGANVVLFDLHHDAVFHACDQFLISRPDSALAIHGDVSNIDDVNRAVAQTTERFGGIDVLVNNAGIFPNKLLSDMTVDDFMRVIDVNLKGVYLFIKAVSEQMKRQGRGGRILNVTSIDALHPSMAGLAHYDASKHGVWGFTKNVALELAKDKIWINALAPGGVATPGVANMQGGDNSVSAELMQAQIEAFLSTIPMHRMADPDEIARMALVLCSDLSSYMTGAQIVVDGGALLS